MKAWRTPIPPPDQDAVCGECGKRLGDRYELDHIIPISKGGSGDPSNLRWVHPKCNRAKGDKVVVPHHVWACPGGCGQTQHTDLNVTGVAHPCPAKNGRSIAFVKQETEPTRRGKQ